MITRAAAIAPAGLDLGGRGQVHGTADGHYRHRVALGRGERGAVVPAPGAVPCSAPRQRPSWCASQWSCGQVVQCPDDGQGAVFGCQLFRYLLCPGAVGGAVDGFADRGRERAY